MILAYSRLVDVKFESEFNGRVSGFRVWSLGSRLKGLGFRVWSLGFRGDITTGILAQNFEMCRLETLTWDPF